MAKKNKTSKKSNVVWRQSSEEATLSQMPKYNGYACGYGAHGSAKYDRNKEKRKLQQVLEDNA